MTVDASDASAWDQVQQLRKAVRAIRDHRLHGAAVQRFLTTSSPADTVESLRYLMTTIDEPGHREAHYAVVQHLVVRAGAGFDGVEAVYRAAHGAGYHPVRMLLLRAPARLVAHPEDVLPDPELLDVPLGRRKSMARGRDRDLLVRLAMDPSPPVVELLYQNPLLLERDVVRVAARRPNMAEVLEITAGHPRWSQRYQVQKALIHNPYCPASISAALVPFMRGRDLAEVSQNLRIHEVVQQTATVLVNWRKIRRAGHSPAPTEVKAP
ncbi:MAG: hypothetical protein ACI9OJ_002713 [Myxococcota bacterium]